MEDDTSGVYSIRHNSTVPETMGSDLVAQHSEITEETAIIDLTSTVAQQQDEPGIHSLESIAYLKKRKASQLLSIELERLRVLNGRMARIISQFVNRDPAELGKRATLIRNAFVEELSIDGQELHGVFLKISRRENVKGSLYINLGADIVRYRWEGTNSEQHIYLNGDGTFLRGKSKSYVTLNRFLEKQMHLVFNECAETRPITRRMSNTLSEVDTLRYEQEMTLYRSISNRILRLFGKGFPCPIQPARQEVEVALSPLDLGITYEEHKNLVRSIGVISTALERAAQAFQEVWSIALAADDSPK